MTRPFRLSLYFRFLDRYWHTLRHLRPVQFYGRLWFRLYRPRPARPERLDLPLRNSQNLTRNPAQNTCSQPPFPLLRPVSMLGPSRFRFLNQTHDAQGPEAWNDPARDKLWLYNLHYFDDLNAADDLELADSQNATDDLDLATASRRADWHRLMIQRWINENPPGQGNGWEPYPTSLRIVNWVKWLLRSDAAILNSLATQAHWLQRRLEHHLLGNHLFANAKALVFAGAFFVGPEAERWLRLGQRLLRRELQEQILPDGGHFERSPMYHAILLEDVLDLLRLGQLYPGTLDAALLRLCETKAAAMQHWLAVMTHPDGQISFFNDAAFGIAPTRATLERYAADLTMTVIPARTTNSPTSLWLRESGYVRLESGPAVALLDCAPIGPDYLPGHAHADTLSFELSLFGQRVIVNGGTSCYGSSPQRLAERGTAAHSTVQINGADSSEVWGGFRVARRARPFDLKVSTMSVSAAHDGYRRLPGRPVHRRQWLLCEDRLVVTDRIEGEWRSAVARFHLHPAVAVSIDGAGGVLRLPDGANIRWQVNGGQPTLVADTWHPEFGQSLPSQCLRVEIMADACALELCWI